MCVVVSFDVVVFASHVCPHRWMTPVTSVWVCGIPWKWAFFSEWITEYELQLF